MKDFLKKLEIGENKVKLSKEEIKAILAEHGKTVTTETEKVKKEYEETNNNMKVTIDDLKKQLENAPKSDEIESLKNKIAEYEDKEAKRIEAETAEANDRILTNNILEAIGDKKFVNDYTKNSIINEIKTALSDTNNQGKSAKDLFKSITKDKTDIFENPNKLADMSGMGDTETNTPKKDIPLIW